RTAQSFKLSGKAKKIQPVRVLNQFERLIRKLQVRIAEHATEDSLRNSGKTLGSQHEKRQPGSATFIRVQSRQPYTRRRLEFELQQFAVVRLTSYDNLVALRIDRDGKAQCGPRFARKTPDIKDAERVLSTVIDKD